MSICSATLLLSSPWLRRTLRCLALSLGLRGVCLWMLSFFNYVRDMHYDMWTRLQDGMEVFTALGQFSFFALVNEDENGTRERSSKCQCASVFSCSIGCTRSRTGSWTCTTGPS